MGPIATAEEEVILEEEEVTLLAYLVHSVATTLLIHLELPMQEAQSMTPQIVAPATTVDSAWAERPVQVQVYHTAVQVEEAGMEGLDRTALLAPADPATLRTV